MIVGKRQVNKCLTLVQCRKDTLFDACLNDVFDIALTVKDADDADGSFVVIHQIINDDIINWKKAHLHGSPWLPVLLMTSLIDMF